MNAYERFLDGQPINSNIPSSMSCDLLKKDFFNCVTQDKNLLTREIKDWTTYPNKVRKLNQDCFDRLGLDVCSNYFTVTEVKY